MPEFPVGVKKVWGGELWMVNEPEYCCKVLFLNEGASGSLHYHKFKKETFMVLKGKIRLEYGSNKVELSAGVDVVTIPISVPHRFTGVEESSILEISTHHDDNDVVRLELSKA